MKFFTRTPAAQTQANPGRRLMDVPVLIEVQRERNRQDEKWGEQNHADGTGPASMPLQPISEQIGWYGSFSDAEDLAGAARSACQANGGPDSSDTWTAILLEEVFEALAESDPRKLRTELIQVAAVASQWVEAIDRRATA